MNRTCRDDDLRRESARGSWQQLWCRRETTLGGSSAGTHCRSAAPFLRKLWHTAVRQVNFPTIFWALVRHRSTDVIRMCGDTDPERDHQGRRPKPTAHYRRFRRSSYAPRVGTDSDMHGCQSGPDSHITDCPGVTHTGFRRYPTSPLGI